jgi:predicted RNase H-like nuclease (RuvC/YqgF family)
LQELDSSHNHFVELEAALGMALEQVEASAEELALLDEQEKSIAELRQNLQYRDERVYELKVSLKQLEAQATLNRSKVVDAQVWPP